MPHWRHGAAPDAPKKPAAQTVQLEFEDAPGPDVVVPLAHSEHDDAFTAANEPALHVAQAAPTTTEPAAHEELHDDEPADDTVPAPQLVQADDELAPQAPEKVPAGHAEHDDEPVAAAKKPGEHVTQSLRPMAEPAADADPAGHNAHAVAAEELQLAETNVPAAHEPQAVHEALDGAVTRLEKVLAGHATQVAFDVAPTALEKKPVPHGVHALELLDDAYVPAAQATQAAPENEVPAGHTAEQAAAPAADTVELAHDTQVDDELAPVAPEAVPAPHRVHDEALAADE